MLYPNNDGLGAGVGPRFPQSAEGDARWLGFWEITFPGF
jgi:hypothetical protein